MHTVLGFSSLLLVVLGSILLLVVLRFLSDWSQRRLVQSFVLTMPLITLGVGISGLHHFTRHFCFTNMPFWDFLLGVVLPLGMVVNALGALGLGGLRLILMKKAVQYSHMPAPQSLQTWTDGLVKHLKIAPVHVRMCVYDQPLAFTCGIYRPTILLSTWMLEHLDQQELEAVLMHELQHVARRDYLFIFFATILRDAFFYMPTNRVAYRQLQREKELVCDDLTVGVTRRPLALASALAKVWLHAAETPHVARFGVVQPLAENRHALNARIERLMARRTTREANQAGAARLRGNILALLILFVTQGMNLLIIFALLDCNPLALTGLSF